MSLRTNWHVPIFIDSSLSLLHTQKQSLPFPGIQVRKSRFSDVALARLISLDKSEAVVDISRLDCTNTCGSPSLPSLNRVQSSSPSITMLRKVQRQNKNKWETMKWSVNLVNQRTLTVGGSITVWLVSSLTRLDLTNLNVKYVSICLYWNCWIQTSQIGDQLYFPFGYNIALLFRRSVEKTQAECLPCVMNLPDIFGVVCIRYTPLKLWHHFVQIDPC